MLPVIPKVRVGEVLHGTRHLRSWLQISSVLAYFENISLNSAFKPLKHVKDLIHCPSKKDRYVVAVNQGHVFAVWGVDKPLVLTFQNYKDSANTNRAYRTDISKSGPFKWSTVPPEPPKKCQQHMSPEIFAHWFIRCNDYLPDLKQWPEYAVRIWAAFQMRGAFANLSRLSVSGTIGTSAPFRMPGMNTDIDKPSLFGILPNYLSDASLYRKRGTTLFTKHRFHPKLINGPRIGDVEARRSALQQDYLTRGRYTTHASQNLPPELLSAKALTTCNTDRGPEEPISLERAKQILGIFEAKIKDNL